jgi:hypothetical protein
MSIFKTRTVDFIKIKENEDIIPILKKKIFDSFNENVLGLGNIGIESETYKVICAIFDLEGFTNFCKQINPQLCVPVF